MKNESYLPPMQILEQKPAYLKVAIALPKNLACFEGHFPDFPILPGVIQIHWALQLAKRYLNVGDAFSGMEQIKFADIVKPNDALSLQLDWDATAGKLGFAYEVCGLKVSSGRIRMTS